MIYGLNADNDRQQGLEFAIATALRNCGRQSGYKPWVKSYWRCISPAHRADRRDALEWRHHITHHFPAFSKGAYG
jgi:hypothetical protein